MKISHLSRTAAAVGALLLVSTGCASERSDNGDVAAPASSASADGASSDAKFGTLDSPCGEGDGGPATEQGVTADSITIGYGDDRGFTASPGLSAEMGDAISAMIAWCNEQGGINGRTIKGNQYDAAYTQAPQVMQKACASDFMLVGHGFALDEAAEPVRVGCNLPSVPGFTVGPNASMGPMKYQAVPLPVDRYNTAPLQLAAQTYPEFKSMDVLRSTSAGVTAGTDRVIAALKTMDITPKDCGVVFNQEGDPSYVPFAEKLKSCGVESTFTANTPGPGQFSMLEALKRVGADILYFGEATWYSPAVAEFNKSGAGDVLRTGIMFQPFENADTVPAVAKYLELMEASDGKIALLGMQATSSFLLWATAADACGADLTRQCVINELSQIHEWTGGGLHAETDPGDAQPASCAVLLSLKGSTWTQEAPKEKGEFACDDSWVIDTDKSTWNAELNEDRISTKFLTDKVLKPTV